MYQYTTMLELLPQKNSERTELRKSTSSQAAFPAKMCHAPALERGLRTAMGKLLAADYGENMQGSLANLDHAGLWQKMCEGYCQPVLISDQEETSELFSQTWPTWGMMRSGHVTVLKPLARPTREKESLSWPTPCVADIFTANLKSTQQKPGSMHSVNLSQCVNWPTPNAEIYKNGAMSNEAWDKRIADNRQNDIAMAVYKVENQGALNADWVEILMNLPVGWTDVDKPNEEISEWPGWPAPMNATQKWATPNCMDMLPSRSFEAMKHQATNGARKNRKLPGNLREQIDPLMRKAYIEASQENGGCLEEEITVSGQHPYEPPRVVVGQKNRAKRLKALGNGCVPGQVYPIFKAIMDIEGATK